MAAPNGLSPTIAAFNEQPWAILAISYRAGNGAWFGMEQEDVVAGFGAEYFGIGEALLPHLAG